MTDTASNPLKISNSAIGVLIVILLAAAALRIHHLGTVHSWFDESLGWQMSQFSISDIIDRSERNVHPPVHFLLLSFWRKLFGGSLFALRCYSLTLGLLTVAGGFFLARATCALDESARKTANLAGWLAAAFIALSSLHVHWSQQIKMYTLGTSLTLWSSWLLLKYFQQRGIWRLALYVPLAAMLTLQHHYGTFTVFAQLLFALIWAGRSSLHTKNWGLFQSIVITTWCTMSLWSLWLPSFMIQRGLVQRSYWIEPFNWQTVANVWAELLTEGVQDGVSPVASLIVAQCVLVAVLLMFVSRLPGLRLIGFLSAIPFLIAVAWSLADHNVVVSRFLINAHVCLLVGIGVLISRISIGTIRNVVAFVAILVFGWTAFEQRQTRNAENSVPGMPEIARTLQEVRRGGEPVLVCNPMLFLNLKVHGSQLDNVFSFGAPEYFPHFQGTPVMQTDEYFSKETLQESPSDWVWALDADEWLGGSWKVRLSADWKMKDERRIREWYGWLVLRAYEREKR